MDYNYVNWKVGTRLIDVDVRPRRLCTLIREEHSRERPRIGVRYDDGEELQASHPSHYREVSSILTIEPEPPDRPICPGCKKEVDYDTCGCGTALKYHGSPMSEGHSFVPLGCDCFRAK